MSSEAIDTITTTLEETSFSKDAEVEEEHTENIGPSLVDMPNEIFFKICSFLDLELVSLVLAKVCVQFQHILEDESLWRYWLSKRLYAKKYPVFDEYVDDFDWRSECINIDKINRVWRDIDRKTHHYIAKPLHCASVDCLLLKNNGNICISGSRDRSMTVWNFEKCEREERQFPELTELYPSIALQNAHGGWVWGLSTPCSSSNLVFSASWDSTVKVWDTSVYFKTIHTFKCSISVLCVSCIDENVAVAGLFSPKVAILDKRTGEKPVSINQIHKRAVLDLTVKSPGSNVVFTGSEDGTVSAFDMRKNEVFKKNLLDPTQEQIYPLKIGGNDQIFPRMLFAGDTIGNVHVIDTEDLSTVSSYPITNTSGKSHKITGLSVGAGAVFTCSHNGFVDVMNPSNPPNRISSVKCVSKELTALSFENNSLAISGDTTTIEFWVPRTD